MAEDSPEVPIQNRNEFRPLKDRALDGDPEAVDQLLNSILGNFNVSTENGDIQVGFGDRNFDEPVPDNQELPQPKRSGLSEQQRKREKEGHRERAAFLKYGPLKDLLVLARRNPDISHTVSATIARYKKRDNILLRGNPGVGTETTIIDNDGERLPVEVATRVKDQAGETRIINPEEADRSYSPGELHRQLAPIFAGLLKNPRSEAYLNIVVDEAAEEISRYILAEINKGNNHGPMVMIGAGLQSQIFNAEFAHWRKNEMVTFEESDTLGGTFNRGEVWLMNSRQRPQDVDFDPVPGTRGNINYLGRAILQLSDITSRVYATNKELAEAVRVNLLFHAHTLLKFRFDGFSINDNPEYSEDYVLHFKNKKGETFDYYTDSAKITGIGEDKIRFEDENDVESQRLIAENQAKFENGEVPQIMTVAQFAQIVGDETNQFPLQEFVEDTLIYGQGDGGKIALGKLLGHETDNRGSTVQLDFPENITWFTNYKTKEDALAKERPRYGPQIGLNLPREGKPDYYSRVKPIEARVLSFKPDGDRVIVVYQEVTTGENGTEVRGEVKEISKKRVIAATGLEQRNNEIFKDLPLLDNKDIENAIQLAGTTDREGFFRFFQPGTTIKYKEEITQGSGMVQAVVESVNNDVAVVKVMYSDGFISKQKLSPYADEIDSFLSQFAAPGSIKSLRVNGLSPRTIEILDPETGRPIAKQLAGYNVGFYGPAAKLPVTEEEKQRSPAINAVPPNTDAIFRYAQLVEKAARLAATEEWPEDAKGLIDFAKALEPQSIQLPERKGTYVFIGNLPARKVVPDVAKGFGQYVNSSDLVKLIVGSHLAEYTFPKGFPKNLDINFELEFEDGKVIEILATPATNLPDTPEYQTLLKTLLNDPNLQKLLYRITENVSGTTQGDSQFKRAMVRIPIAKQEADLLNINAFVPYSNKGQMYQAA